MRSHLRDLRFRLGAAVAALSLSPVAVAAVIASQSPTLGELALKEQERRKALKVRGKVLTEEDLPRMPPPPAVPAVASGPAVKAQQDEQALRARAADVKDESWWRQRIAQVRDELRRNEILADALQTRINALTTDVASRDDPYQRARLSDDRQKAIVELDRIRSEVELLKKKIGEIEEEARRAGLPAGWLR